MNIIKDSTPNKTNGRNGQTISRIVLHSTYGSYSGSVAWLKNPAAKVSAHYIISDTGEIRQLVDDKDTAWSNGNLQSNRESVAIETTDNKKKDITPKAKEALIWLVTDIKKRYNIKDIKYHREIVATACPYLNIDKAWFINSNTPMTDLQACLVAHKEARESADRKDQQIKELKVELTTCGANKVSAEWQSKKYQEERDRAEEVSPTLEKTISNLETEVLILTAQRVDLLEKAKQPIPYKRLYEEAVTEIQKLELLMTTNYVHKSKNEYAARLQEFLIIFGAKN